MTATQILHLNRDMFAEKAKDAQLVTFIEGVLALGKKSLRDEFAMAALPEVMRLHDSYIREHACIPGNGTMHEITLSIAYRYATAALSQRERKET